MQRSFIDRVFPQPKKTSALLPQYDEPSLVYHDERPMTRISGSDGPIRLGSVASKSAGFSSNGDHDSKSQADLQPTPLSASLVHHDDPFLAVDRASARLQQTIQSLLDFQSQALSGRHDAGQSNIIVSLSSHTPTSSAMQGSTTASIPHRVVPKRQPKDKHMTLKKARKVLGDSMRECGQLKEEELKLTVAQQRHRRAALDHISSLETKTEAVQTELRLLNERAEAGQSRDLRAEAETIDQEIRELEDRLLQLKVRRRHLLDQASQIESANASEISSYKGTLRSLERQRQKFLRNPPITHGLGPRMISTHEDQDMYALRPERRTVELAKEQWSQELRTLESHEASLELDRQALAEGADTWVEAVKLIDDFEQTLRQKIKAVAEGTTEELVKLLDATAHHLYETFKLARSRNWNLLVCAIGSEIEALREARLLLSPGQTLPAFYDVIDHYDEGVEMTVTLSSSPTTPIMKDDRSISHSNESLKATLKQFPVSDVVNGRYGESSGRTERSIPSHHTPAAQPGYGESEDDEPGPDFLISHTD